MGNTNNFQMEEAAWAVAMDQINTVALYVGYASLAADLGYDKWLNESERLVDAAGGRKKVIKGWLKTIKLGFAFWAGGGYMDADYVIEAQLLALYARRHATWLSEKRLLAVADVGKRGPDEIGWEETAPYVAAFAQRYGLPEDWMTPAVKLACEVALATSEKAVEEK